MGRPRKVKESVVEVEKNANWKKLKDLENIYEQELQGYAWAYEHTQDCKKKLEKAHKEMVLFEANNDCKYKD